MNIELSLLPESSNFLQSPFWGRFKSFFGWKSYNFNMRYQNKDHYILVFSRTVSSLFSVGYAPLPDFSDIPEAERTAFLKMISKKIKRFLPKTTIFMRWDLDWATTGDEFPHDLKHPLKKAPLSIQPPDTTILSLDHDEESLLAAMHKKTRYNIALAHKKGVIIERSGSDGVARWYKIYEETARRDHIAIHSLEYYQKFFQVSSESGLGPQARLYLAYHEEDLLAGIITLFYNNTATYVYGASSNIKRNLMASYALQWQAITDAKKAGCQEYDFFGIPPKADPDHPMYGLYQFKAGFGGVLIHRYGAWDYAYSKVFYGLYCLLEGYRAKKRRTSKKTVK